MTTYLQNEIYEKLRRLAKHRGLTIQELIKEFLESISDEEQNEVGFYLSE